MSLHGRSFVVRLGSALALSTVALLVGWMIGGAAPARGTTADGDVQLQADPGAGQCTVGTDPNCSNAETGITDIGNSDAFVGDALGNGDGIIGVSQAGTGVHGASQSGAGVRGYAYGAEPGVYARNVGGTGYGLWAQSDQATAAHMETGSQYGAGLEVQITNVANARGAVEAQTTGDGQGVNASSLGGGIGVVGESDKAGGIGMEAKSSNGLALKTVGQTTFTGKTNFARSGSLPIPAGALQVTKTPIGLFSSSNVLATIQGNVAGVWIQGVTLVKGSSGSFTVHLNKRTPSALKVAWFVLG